jgi:cell division protein ZapA (FtsZ GTPase activity inhibitor)
MRYRVLPAYVRRDDTVSIDLAAASEMDSALREAKSSANPTDTERSVKLASLLVLYNSI